MSTERLTATTSGLGHSFRMTWHQEGAGECTRRVLISGSKEELIAALSIPVPALVTVELIETKFSHSKESLSTIQNRSFANPHCDARLTKRRQPCTT